MVIYFKLIMWNSILEKIILPLGDLINNSSFTRDLKYWRNVDKMSEEELKFTQRKKLEKILKHAVNNSEFYKKMN